MHQNNFLVDDDIIVGEGVALDVPVAGAFVRIFSGIIDGALSLILLIACFYAFSEFASFSNQAIARIISILTVVFCVVALPTMVETLTRGKSVGKFCMGTRVVRTDHGVISFRHAFTRTLIGFFEIWMSAGTIAVICTLFTKQARRAGDLAAGTIVIKERIPLRVAPNVSMPPELEHWAKQADIGVIPAGLALSARQFLIRAERMSPPARAQMAQRLAAQLQDFVYPLPTPIPPPELFIAGVLAERSARAIRRQQSNARISAALLRQD